MKPQTTSPKPKRRRRKHAPVREQTRIDQRVALNDQPPAWPWSAECPRCEKRFAPASVVLVEATEAELTESYGFPAQEIRFYCDHCDHLVCAFVTKPDPHERVYRQFRPISGDVWRDDFPRVLDHEVICARTEIDAFLIRHPEARGVVAA